MTSFHFLFADKRVWLFSVVFGSHELMVTTTSLQTTLVWLDLYIPLHPVFGFLLA
jgi:hypothetical protein